jgi:hypothetical protein
MFNINKTTIFLLTILLGLVYFLFKNNNIENFSEGETIEIKDILRNSSPENVDLENIETVKQLRTRIKNDIGIDIGENVLTFNGVLLEDNKKLKDDYGIKNKDLLKYAYNPNDQDILSGKEINYIDRINVKGQEYGNETAENDKYAYCLGGVVSCPSGTLVEINDKDSEWYNNEYFGKTYEPLCKNKDGSLEYPVCSNYANYNETSKIKMIEIKDDKYTDISFTYPVNIDTNYKGFTTAYSQHDVSYVPFNVNNGKLYFSIYDLEKKDFDRYTTNICLATDSKDNCDKLGKVFEEEKEKNNVSGEDGNNNTDNKNEEKESKCGASEGTIKCLANYGTNVGEDLCCGQTGVLQNTEYVCPEEMPNCKGFTCGSTFGYCHK